MEFETRVMTLIMFGYLFTLIVFGICFYMLFQQYDNNQIRDQNYDTISEIMKDQMNISIELTNKSIELTDRIDTYLATTSVQMDTLRTEDNLNFFRLWLLTQPKRDMDFIESQTKNMNLSCLSSIDGIGIDKDIFRMSLTVLIENIKESRIMRFSRSAVTCHYFSMEIPCDELCNPMIGDIE